MAIYKYGNYLKHSTDSAFDGERGPGVTTPHSGIYRCLGCDKEIAANQGNPLPPQNHHQHSYSQGSIRWQLLVYAE